MTIKNPSPTLRMYSTPELVAELERRGVKGELYWDPPERDQKTAEVQKQEKIIPNGKIDPTDMSDPAAEKQPDRHEPIDQNVSVRDEEASTENISVLKPISQQMRKPGSRIPDLVPPGKEQGDALPEKSQALRDALVAQEDRKKPQVTFRRLLQQGDQPLNLRPPSTSLRPENSLELNPAMSEPWASLYLSAEENPAVDIYPATPTNATSPDKSVSISAKLEEKQQLETRLQEIHNELLQGLQKEGLDEGSK